MSPLHIVHNKEKERWGFKKFFRGIKTLLNVLGHLLLITMIFSSSSFGADVEAVCGDVLNGSTGNSSASTQKLQYCQSAKSAQESVDANSTLWKVWGGVAVVCSSACAASMMGAAITGYDQYVCMGATVVGSGTDALVTKNFASALTGIMTAGGSYLINNMNKPAEEAAKEGAKEGTKETAKQQKPQKDWGSCLSAAVATVQAYSKYSSMKSSESSVESNLQSAQQLASTATGTDATNTSVLPPATSSGGTAGGTAGASASRATASAAANNNVADPRSCTNFKTTGSYDGFIQCAVANDKTLPSFVGTPQFAKDFQKASGMPVLDFANNSKNPTRDIAAAMGAKMNSDQSGKLLAALRKVEDHYMMDEAGVSYAGGGGRGSHSGGSDPGAEIGEVMGKLMGQFMPGQGEEKSPSGVNTAAFGNGLDRKLASSSVDLSQDRTISLFDRVTYRYGKVTGGFLR